MTALLALLWFAASPEQRAVDYLSGEVPRWRRENGCFSCHNNGDGARALYAARRRGYQVPETALEATAGWLLAPAMWDAANTEAAFKDKKLARIQFAAALAEADAAGAVKDVRVLRQAAKLLLDIQDADGAWRVDPNAGSPATYGDALATYLSIRALQRTGGERFEAAASRAAVWLAAQKPRSVLQTAAVLLAVPALKDRLVPALLAAQNRNGGWGLQAGSPAEPFDTAVAVLALQPLGEAASVARGRAYLVATQLPTGGWPETTRPAGGSSYAQHVSTSAWATLALLETRAGPKPVKGSRLLRQNGYPIFHGSRLLPGPGRKRS